MRPGRGQRGGCVGAGGQLSFGKCWPWCPHGHKGWWCRQTSGSGHFTAVCRGRSCHPPPHPQFPQLRKGKTPPQRRSDREVTLAQCPECSDHGSSYVTVCLPGAPQGLSVGGWGHRALFSLVIEGARQGAPLPSTPPHKTTPRDYSRNPPTGPKKSGPQPLSPNTSNTLTKSTSHSQGLQVQVGARGPAPISPLPS